jgi:hypothetical protein
VWENLGGGCGVPLAASFLLLAHACWQSCDDEFDFTRGANPEIMGFQDIIVSWTARHLIPYSLGIKIQLKWLDY